MGSETVLKRFDELGIWKQADLRAPHKPLLVLYALGRWQAGQKVCLFVRQFIRRKYAGRSCQEHVAIPPKPPQPIDKGLAGPGLLAHIITNNFAYHLPLYRQEQILAHHGVTISRSTLCGWLAQSAELFAPLYNLMIRRVRGSRIVWTDDTTVPVWDPTLPRTRTGRF